MPASRDLDAVDGIFERFFAATPAPAPGIVYGVVAGGSVVRVHGLGTLRIGEAVVPDRSSVFRIASMTKSFTAAAVLLLRDEGRLSLDHPIGAYVPDAADLRGPTTDSPPVTVRHLLTMSAGFPTDDPWGDRQQALPLDRFGALLRSGLSFAWPPGVRFEYSNLSYAMLGRVVSAVAGAEYRDVVRQRLLEPLGMTATGFDAAAVDPAVLARGYVWRDDAWQAEPMDGYGAFASMGGLFTTIDDLGRWVTGLLDAYPPRDDPEVGHPLSRAARREMQDGHRGFEPELTAPSADAPPDVRSGAYGFGLEVRDDLRIGRIVSHGGGYPGFGSHMRWHPASGLGVVAFGNARYAPMSRPAGEALLALVLADGAPVRRLRPAPPTVAARAVVERLLAAWDDALAASLFAENVALDEPLERRRATLDRLRMTHGTLRPDRTATPEPTDSPFHEIWWLAGERGRVRVEIRLTPEQPPRVQTLDLRSVPDPPAHLSELAARVARLLDRPSPAWPTDVALDPSIDRVALDRALRAAEALYGPFALGPPIDGDGRRTGTWRLAGERGALDLKLARSDADGPLTDVSLVPVTRTPPVRAA